METKTCNHLEEFKIVYSGKDKCEECEKTGDNWVHLRTCQSCGLTLCCDSSINKHARKHRNESSHLVIISAEPGEKWAYCYDDDVYLKYE